MNMKLRFWAVLVAVLLSWGSLVEAQSKLAAPKVDVESVQRTLSTVSFPQVISELELIEEQTSELKSMSTAVQQEIAAAFIELRNKIGSRQPTQEDLKEFSNAVDQINVRTKTKITGILLPHQRKLLAQIEFQRDLSGLGVASLLTKQELAATLSISNEQHDDIEKQFRESEREIERIVVKLRAARDRKLLELLTPEQKAQWRDLVGQPCPLFSAVDVEEPRRQKTP